MVPVSFLNIFLWFELLSVVWFLMVSLIQKQSYGLTYKFTFNKSEHVGRCFNYTRGVFMSPTTSKIERLATIVKGFQPLTVVAKLSVLDFLGRTGYTGYWIYCQKICI